MVSVDIKHHVYLLPLALSWLTLGCLLKMVNKPAWDLPVPVKGLPVPLPPVKGLPVPVKGLQVPVKGLPVPLPPVKGLQVPVKGLPVPVKGLPVPLPVKGLPVPVKGQSDLIRHW